METTEEVERRSVHNQVIGYLRGRATALDEERANAPTSEARDDLQTRVASYEVAAHLLGKEEL